MIILSWNAFYTDELYYSFGIDAEELCVSEMYESKYAYKELAIFADMW